MTKFSREWAMPSSDTFTIEPIAALLARHLNSWMLIVDPFAGNSTVGSFTNDLNPDKSAQYHLDAIAFLDLMKTCGHIADAVLFDPPYSPRQISEVYNKVGLSTGQETGQNGALYKRVHSALDRLLKPGGLAISCGWNTCGFGKNYELLEVLIVAHGGAHNDTLVTVERKKLICSNARPEPHK